MTRKDYVLIAAALKEARDMLAANGANLTRTQCSLNGADASAIELADALSRDNPRFDRERFLKAAGVQS